MRHPRSVRQYNAVSLDLHNANFLLIFGVAIVKPTLHKSIGVGLEGGVQKVGDKWFESGWIAVVDRHVGL
jgi:hypothetical protein